MPALPLAKGYYRRLDNTPVRLVNAYYEQDPTNLKDQVSLISRPGMAPFATAPAGAYVAGLLRREGADGGLLCVSGENAYAISALGVVTNAGTGVLGAARVRMATDGTNTMIVRAGAIYLQQGVAVSLVEMPDDIMALDVAFLAGRFWIATELDGRVYFTVPGETTVDALNYFSAESAPDPLVGIAVSGDELVFLGRSSIEYWNPTGDQDLPAQRIIGRASKVGCASVHSIAGEDLAAWVGDDCVVYRSGDALPVAIGDAGLTEIIRKARPTLDETDPLKTLTGRAFSIEKHSFYLLDVPGFGTYAYDFTTGQWSQFTSHDRDLFAGGCFAKLSGGRMAVGGTYDAKVRLFTPDARSDDGAPLVRVYPAVLPVAVRSALNNIVLSCTVGSADLAYPVDNPKVAERHSRDEGKSWSDWKYASLGRQGAYNTKPTFKALGRMEPPHMAVEFRVSDPIEFTLRSADYNVPVR